MAIRLVTGALGGGKTFFAVKHLTDNYFDYDKDADLWRKKKDKQDVTIFTNIDGLLLDHLNLDDAIQKSGVGLEGFFTVEYQTKIQAKYKKIVYVIDETQRYFHRRFYNKEVFFFFEYSRHHGIDIYMITPHKKKICWDIAELAEYEFRAVKRTLSLVGEMKYNMLIDYEIVGRKAYKKDKKIFELYKSMEIEETEKQKNPMLKYIAVPVVLLIISFLLLRHHFVHLEKPIAQTPTKTENSLKTVQQQNTIQQKKISNSDDDHVWIPSNGVIWKNNKIYKILDPNYKILVRPSGLSCPMRVSDQQVYIKVPKPKETGQDEVISSRNYIHRSDRRQM